MRETKSARRLREAGFTVHASHDGRWYEVSRDGEDGLVLRQHENCWHWFSKLHAATASHNDISRCDSGGLGDALDTDAQVRTYERLVRNAPRHLVNEYVGLAESRY
jgi:hypothetical protein